jgi:hypothetical protein
LQPVGRVTSSGVGGLQFAWDEVRALFGSVVLDSGLTLEELARATGWKYESIAHWIGEGLMSCEKTTRRGQETRVITPTHLLAFTRQYIPLADLARLLGTSPSGVAKRLVGMDIIGSQHLPRGAKRGGLIRLADMAALITPRNGAEAEAGQPPGRAPRE